MIFPKIDPESFLNLVRTYPVIAFQAGEYGYAVAAKGEAYYVPLTHPGGGNLPIPSEFMDALGDAFIRRMETPALRTLRPTAKPIPTAALQRYISTFDGMPDFEQGYARASGDHPSVSEYETQVVITAMEEHGRPDLQATMDTLKLSVLSEALDLVIEHASTARELAEVGEIRPHSIRLHLMQASTAMKEALSYLLKP